MDIVINASYHRLRLTEMELTADYINKLAAEKEREREERGRLREERQAQVEFQRQREKLERERAHYANALAALEAKGDLEAVQRLRDELGEIDRAIKDVDYRAANIRAGYVYVISNLGAFGDQMVKVGMTRRLEPMDRIKELSDASVPFNFDVHAIHSLTTPSASRQKCTVAWPTGESTASTCAGSSSTPLLPKSATCSPRSPETYWSTPTPQRRPNTTSQ